MLRNHSKSIHNTPKSLIHHQGQSCVNLYQVEQPRENSKIVVNNYIRQISNIANYFELNIAVMRFTPYRDAALAMKSVLLPFKLSAVRIGGASVTEAQLHYNKEQQSYFRHVDIREKVVKNDREAVSDNLLHLVMDLQRQFQSSSVGTIQLARETYEQYFSGGAVKAKDSIVGNNCILEDGCMVASCVIMDNCFVGRGVRLENCVVGCNARLEVQGEPGDKFVVLKGAQIKSQFSAKFQVDVQYEEKTVFRSKIKNNE